ncbi:MAG: DUF4232 domain-containing protein [Actinomycetota bacterium]|nr:DUF4232 domain-containing protein [Actinomycetota bacterium]
MDDDLTQLERVLKDRAAEVSQVRDVPPTMLARARRRVARNALASVLGAVVIVVGASAGLANLGVLHGSGADVPGGSGAVAPSTAAPSTACAAADLRAEVSLEGAAGSVEGSIGLTNVGGTTCTLTGQPTVSIFSSPGHEVALQVTNSQPQWQADGASAPQGWPVASLHPGSAASVRVRWSNACPQLSGPASWKIDLGNGDGTLDVSSADASFVPPCNGPTEPSTLEVGPFEPSAGA